MNITTYYLYITTLNKTYKTLATCDDNLHLILLMKNRDICDVFVYSFAFYTKYVNILNIDCVIVHICS